MITSNRWSRFKPPADSRESSVKGTGFPGLNAFSGQCQNFKQSERFLHLLVAGDVLEHSFCFAIDGDDDRRPCLGHSADYVRRFSLELADRLYLIGQLHSQLPENSGLRSITILQPEPNIVRIQSFGKRPSPALPCCIRPSKSKVNCTARHSAGSQMSTHEILSANGARG